MRSDEIIQFISPPASMKPKKKVFVHKYTHECWLGDNERKQLVGEELGHQLGDEEARTNST